MNHLCRRVSTTTNENPSPYPLPSGERMKVMGDSVFVLRIVSILFCVLYLCLLASPPAQAQQIEMSSSLNPVGSGARATGMGGAFIGVADDATAASWNPAGLIQLEKPEVSLVYAGQAREQTYHSTLHPEIDGSNSMDSSGLNYASIAYPFVLLGRNMIVSLNYQRLYEMDKKVNLNYSWPMVAGSTLGDKIDFQQKGFLYTLSPAMAVQVRPNLYLGATLNFWRDALGQNGWESTYQAHGSGFVLGNPIVRDMVWTQKVDFKGFNAHTGFLWNVTETFIVGGVYKSAFNADLTKNESVYTRQVFGGTPSESFASTAQDLTMKMPEAYGLGFQYRRSDKLIFALDAYRTQWSRFYLKDPYGNAINPMDGAPLGEGRLKDTMQVRFGTEYLFIGNNRTLALRAGLFSDPEPTKTKPDAFYGFSLGTGYSTQQFSLDASYQYRWGNNVEGDISSVQHNSVDIVQQTLMLSGILYF